MVPQGYMMNRLQHEPLNGIYEHELFRAMISILSQQVWNRRHVPNNWRFDLEVFCNGLCPEMDIRHMLSELFPKKEIHGCYIHGDPTLSNLMADKDCNIYLIDPIKPIGKMPWMQEVDVGKMLQSVIGWEHVAFGWDMPDDRCIDLFDHVFSEAELQRSVFWLMIHAMRILPYANKRKDIVAHDWAKYVYEYIHRNIWRDSPCSMLLTLTEHSRIQGMQYWPPIAQSESNRQQTSLEKLGESGSGILTSTDKRT